MSDRTYSGTCRCGATKVTLLSRWAPERFQPRSDAQTCDFCRRYQGIGLSDPSGRLLIEPGNETTVRRFASGEVAFHFCAKCAELTYAVCLDLREERKVAVARRDLFVEIAASAQPVTITNFEGGSLVDARKRRSENWTPCEALSVP